MNPLAMLNNHPFWASIVLASVVWYSSVTIYVAIRGSLDIKHMLGRLAAQRDASALRDESTDT